ncbi:trimeric intracellular cation channel type B-A [Clonorchis sinensis]|uniref:Trimeric intracellular cation channel type B-A n=1 Tax=Clonorchis sinensis TaxID=79923 RepID=G7Y524_CLOSI|nr:trimeric intracellular cation channel type B-A [Clonorchis sinensis]
MDPAIIEDVANSFAKLRMYPYFDVCNYILMSMAVKEDTPQSGSTAFSRRHPFSCWLATMLMCFGGAILSSFICGAPLFVCFDDTRGVLTATVVWYLINYFPFDLVYRLCKFLPFRLIICSLKEVQRARKIAIGVHHGLHQFPESGVTCVLLGLLKGAGYLEMKLFQRLVRGVWLPAATEFLHPTFTTKISLLASVAYYMRHWDVIPLSENQLFLAVAAIFVYLRSFACGAALSSPLKHWISDRTVALLKSQRNISTGPERNLTRRIIKHQMKMSVQADREVWWTRKAKEMEEARRSLELIPESGPWIPPVSETIKHRNGMTILSKEERLEPWAEYFEQQLSWPPASTHLETTVDVEPWKVNV